MPNVGPIDGWRMPTVARLPMYDRAWPRPTVVVVLPSPSGVGVIAETTTYLAFGRSASSSIASSLIFATSYPYGSSRCGPMPIWAAISGMGCSLARRAISRSVGKVTAMPSLPSSREQAGQGVLAPLLGRFDLVKGEHGQPSPLPVGRGEVRQQPCRKAPGVISARLDHP